MYPDDEEVANDNWDYYYGNAGAFLAYPSMTVRVDAIRALQVACKCEDGAARQMLVKLFDLANWRSLRRMHAFGDDASRWMDAKLRLLGGDHSYAIYKAMLTKKDAS